MAEKKSAAEQFAEIQLRKMMAREQNQKGGCIGCLGCLGLIIVIAIFGSAINGGGSNRGRTVDLSVQRVVSRKHGWIIANKVSRSNDFWTAPADFCIGIRRSAEEVYNAVQEHREIDDSFIATLPGHDTVENAVRVRILGHTKINCGLSHATSLTRIEVNDPDSHVNGHRGYIVEGMLSKQ